MVFCLTKTILLLKRSKAMMPLVRVPFVYFLLFSIV